jgi:hypothetical protein
VDAGSTVDGRGRSHHPYSTVGSAIGGGPGGGGRGVYYGSGAGHGGKGGGSNGSTTTGGPAYGTLDGYDALAGSHGGNGYYATTSAGGKGGAGLGIHAENVTISGLISVKGNNASTNGVYSGGGGSGGSVVIRTKSLTHTGTIEASGGSRAATAGGGGAGGRVKTYYETKTGTGATSVVAGASYTAAAVGTTHQAVEVYAAPFSSSYASTGTRTHDISLALVDSVDTANISWNATTPVGTQARLEVSLDNVNWADAPTNGPIPGILRGDNLQEPPKRLHTRVTLTTSNGAVAPILHDVSVDITRAVGTVYETSVSSHVSTMQTSSDIAESIGSVDYHNPDNFTLEYISTVPAQSLVVDNTSGNVTLTTGTYEYDQVHIKDNKILYINGEVTIKAKSFITDAGSIVDGSGRSSVVGGQGPGLDGGTANDKFASGAGHGGAGGASASGKTGGPSYGIATGYSVSQGSSGGKAEATQPGGQGGSALTLIANTTTIQGPIRMNGANGVGDGSDGAGGGSGGGVVIRTQILNQTALISADGGLAGNSLAGSGAGGRIKLYYVSKTGTGSTTVIGGTGTYAGSAGSIHQASEAFTTPYIEEYALSRSRVIEIPAYMVKRVRTSTISWIENKPASTSILIETSFDNLTWTTMANGAVIVGAEFDANLTGKTLYVRQTLTTSNNQVTPVIDDFTVTIPRETRLGYWRDEALAGYATPISTDSVEGGITSKVVSTHVSPIQSVIEAYKTFNNVKEVMSYVSPIGGSASIGLAYPRQWIVENSGYELSQGTLTNVEVEGNNHLALAYQFTPVSVFENFDDAAKKLEYRVASGWARAYLEFDYVYALRGAFAANSMREGFVQTQDMRFDPARYRNGSVSIDYKMMTADAGDSFEIWRDTTLIRTRGTGVASYTDTIPLIDGQANFIYFRFYKGGSASLAGEAEVLVKGISLAYEEFMAKPYGERLSPVYNLDDYLTETGDTKLTWDYVQSAGTSIAVDVRIDNGAWLAATNGGAIPGIIVGEDFSTKTIQFRQKLTSTPTGVRGIRYSPILNTMTAEITLQRGVTSFTRPVSGQVAIGGVVTHTPVSHVLEPATASKTSIDIYHKYDTTHSLIRSAEAARIA